MRKIICAFAVLALLLSGCSKYAEPDVSELMPSVLACSSIDDFAYADDNTVGIIFDIDLSEVEEYSCSYSGKGGFADMVAIFKLYDEDNAQKVSDMLLRYKDSRYNDFKGYAPFEAEKVKNGKVLTYGRYVLFVVVGDISTAQETIEAAFKL